MSVFSLKQFKKDENSKEKNPTLKNMLCSFVDLLKSWYICSVCQNQKNDSLSQMENATIHSSIELLFHIFLKI